MRLETVRRPDPLCTERSDMLVAAAIARPVQCVVSPGGSVSVSATTRSTSAGGNGGRPGLLVFSRSRPATPSRMNRSCQRPEELVQIEATLRMAAAAQQAEAEAQVAG